MIRLSLFAALVLASICPAQEPPKFITIEERVQKILALDKSRATEYAELVKQIDALNKALAEIGQQPVPIPPVPGPGPQPQPIPPTPEPNNGMPAWFAIVADSGTPSQWWGDVLGSPKVITFVRALRAGRAGPIHRIIDVRADGDDPAAKYYKAQATGKTLPRMWLLDKDAKLIKELECPTTPETFIAAFDPAAGKPRSLGLVMAKPRLAWKSFGDTPRVPLIRRENWRPVDLSAFLPPVYDQDGRGQCASSAACTVVEFSRLLAGLRHIHLSAGDLYSRVNGGRDQGSMLEDNLDELLRNGVATAASVKYVWDGRRHDTAAIKAERLQYRVDEAYLCTSFDAMASAIQQGFVVEHGLMWRDNFEPDADGWLPSVGRGGAGGHALVGYGLAKRGNQWGILTRNSWSPAWGHTGNCIIPESLFDSNITGYWAVRSTVQTPTDFPFPKTARRKLDLFERFALAP